MIRYAIPFWLVSRVKKAGARQNGGSENCAVLKTKITSQWNCNRKLSAKRNLLLNIALNCETPRPITFGSGRGSEKQKKAGKKDDLAAFNERPGFAPLAHR
jgi:hypothetical protein